LIYLIIVNILKTFEDIQQNECKTRKLFCADYYHVKDHPRTITSRVLVNKWLWNKYSSQAYLYIFLCT